MLRICLSYLKLLGGGQCFSFSMKSVNLPTVPTSASDRDRQSRYIQVVGMNSQHPNWSWLFCHVMSMHILQGNPHCAGMQCCDVLHAICCLRSMWSHARSHVSQVAERCWEINNTFWSFSKPTEPRQHQQSQDRSNVTRNNWLDWTEYQYYTSSGVILRHLLELAPAAWHTAYARHQQSSARWKSHWHTDGQSGLNLKQTTQIYLFTMRLMYTC